jgi:DNA-binding CsgD family transcriptional regulator
LTGLLLDGLSNTEIARGLDISAYIVQDHVKAVLGKLGVHSKRELIAGMLGQRLSSQAPARRRHTPARGQRR